MTRSMPKHLASRVQRLSAEVRPWRETEEKEILKALTISGGDKFEAALLLGISKNKVYRKVAEYEGRAKRSSTSSGG